jgi:hypothetical protein
VSVTVAQLRAGIAANLATITDVQVLAYPLSNPTPPAFLVYPSGTEYNASMARGLDVWTFTVEAIVNTGSDQDAEKLLDLYVAPTGATSVRAAIESDKTLGGVASAATVTRCSGIRLEGDERGVYLVARWTVEIYASGL